MGRPAPEGAGRVFPAWSYETRVPGPQLPAGRAQHGFVGGREARVMTTKTQVWVQLTTGGKPYPPTLQEMFLDPMFFGMEIWPIDQPASFAALLPAAPAPQPARGAAPPQGRGALGGGTERDEPPDYPWEPS